jgi:hypothetical protein
MGAIDIRYGKQSPTFLPPPLPSLTIMREEAAKGVLGSSKYNNHSNGIIDNEIG